MVISKNLKIQIFHNLVMELKITKSNSNTRVDLEVLETCFNSQVFRGSFNTILDFDSYEDHDLILACLNFLKSRDVHLNEILGYIGFEDL